MKTPRILEFVTVGLIASSVSSFYYNTLAAESNPGPATQAVSIQNQKELSKYDTNQNGRLDGKEREALLRDASKQRETERAAHMRATTDAAKAAAAEQHARQKISPKLLEKYDANKNGKMDPQEWQRHRQDLLKARAARLAENQQTEAASATGGAPSVTPPSQP
jgi:hypothetical protein